MEFLSIVQRTIVLLPGDETSVQCVRVLVRSAMTRRLSIV